MSAYRRVHREDEEQDFLGTLLGQMDDIAKAPTTTRKRKPEHDAPNGYSNGKPKARTGGYERNTNYADADTSSDGFVDTGFPSGPPSEDDLDVFNPTKKIKIEDAGVTPAIERMDRFHVASSGDEGDAPMNDSFDDIDMDAFMEIDEDLMESTSKPAPKVIKKEEPNEVKLKPSISSKPEDKKKSLDDTPTWLSVYDSLTVTKDDTLGPAAGSSSKASGSKDASVLEEDGSLRFFWLDYLEHEGKLYFIGKTQDKKTKLWLSCCVTVENLQRNLFVLPRERRVEEDPETGELYETDVVPSLQDVYGDFDRVRKKAGIKSFKAKFVKRRYAFGEKDVPRNEAQWLKVVYGFDGTSRAAHMAAGFNFCFAEPQIPANVSSPNFSRVFGTSTSAFELLVLKRKIMGPCWLQIKKPVMEHKGVSVFDQC